jgi:hypothetical protein
MNHLGALAPVGRGFLKPIEEPAHPGLGVEADESHRHHSDAA